MVSLEIRDLFSGSMHEHEIRDDRYKPFGFHSVIDSYGIVFRYEIFQAILTFEYFFRFFLVFISAHDEPTDSSKIFPGGYGGTHSSCIF